MRPLGWNVALAALWAAVTGLSLGSLLFGFLLGYGVLWLASPSARRTGYFRKAGRLVTFAAFFLKELAVATFKIAYDVLTPTHHMVPAVVGVPLEVRTDAEIVLLATVVTLTPGTLALDVSTDRKTLYVHALYAPDPEALRQAIKRGFERRVLELLR